MADNEKGVASGKVDAPGDGLARLQILPGNNTANYLEQAAFSYEGLPADVVSMAEEEAAAIRGLHDRHLDVVIAIGRKLDKLRAAMPGHFDKWIACKFGWSRRTAFNYMGAAEAYGGDPAKVQRVAHLPLRVLYRIASVPGAFEQVLRRDTPILTEDHADWGISEAKREKALAAAKARSNLKRTKEFKDRKAAHRAKEEKRYAAFKAEEASRFEKESAASKQAIAYVFANMEPGAIGGLIALIEEATPYRFLSDLKAEFKRRAADGDRQ